MRLLSTLSTACLLYLVASAAQAAVIGKVTVTADQAPAMSGKDAMMTVKKGESFDVTEIRGDWYGLSPSRGWIHKANVRFEPTTAGGLSSASQAGTPAPSAAKKTAPVRNPEARLDELARMIAAEWVLVMATNQTESGSGDITHIRATTIADSADVEGKTVRLAMMLNTPGSRQAAARIRGACAGDPGLKMTQCSADLGLLYLKAMTHDLVRLVADIDAQRTSLVARTGDLDVMDPELARVKGGAKLRRVAGRSKSAAPLEELCESRRIASIALWAIGRPNWPTEDRECTRTWTSG